MAAPRLKRPTSQCWRTTTDGRSQTSRPARENDVLRSKYEEPSASFLVPSAHEPLAPVRQRGRHTESRARHRFPFGGPCQMSDAPLHRIAYHDAVSCPERRSPETIAPTDQRSQRSAQGTRSDVPGTKNSVRGTEYRGRPWIGPSPRLIPARDSLSSVTSGHTRVHPARSSIAGF